MRTDDLGLSGSLLAPGFVENELQAVLIRFGLSPANHNAHWTTIQDGLRVFGGTGGPVRVLRHVVEPLSRALGYVDIRRCEPVTTRDGADDGGHALRANGSFLRVWTYESETGLETVSKRPGGPRASPVKRAIRVLRASGESSGLISNGQELRLLLCDPNGADAQMIAALSGRAGWAGRSEPPWSFAAIAALAAPKGVAASPDIFEAARLYQAAVTKSLRFQARMAIEGFVRNILEHPGNKGIVPDADILWRQALTVVYRLLFVLKLESETEPGRGFGFARSNAWRRSLSPNRALGPLARRHLDLGHDTGRMLEDGLRTLFQTLRNGLSHTSFSIAPLGGALFDPGATRILDNLHWGERAVALLLDRLLWTMPNGRERDRVHYGVLDVEELGRVYESLLDLEPAIAAGPMLRSWHGRLETVHPALRPPGKGEELVPGGQFFLRTGLRRRAGGAYYTPHAFVRFLVRETLTPLISTAIETAEPAAILRIKVVDPAMGSGHFLVEACRFLADALYEACRRCDTIATPDALARIDALPDPDRRLAAYLPSRCHDRPDSGPARERAMAICRRLVAVHCLYGMDCDPMAVELAKLSIWLESFAEGLPLTFLDHRLISGDSIGGPFFHQMSYLPVGGAALDPLLARGVTDRLQGLMQAAMTEIDCLEASIGTVLADNSAKENAKRRLDALLSPLRALARAWPGAVASGAREANDAWLGLAQSVADTGVLPHTPHRDQLRLLANGAAALPPDLMFPEIFHGPTGGFHAVLGNPPWDVVHYQTKEFLARYDPAVMDAPTKRERDTIEHALLCDPAIAAGFARYKIEFVERKRLCDRMFPRTGPQGSVDLFQIFTERMLDCVGKGGALGVVVPSSLHANEGTAHLRKKLMSRLRLESCFCFENRKKLFDIHGRQKFSLIVARDPGPTDSFRCAFYLDGVAALNEPGRVMSYHRGFLAATGGEPETFLELRGTADLAIAQHMFVGRTDMKTWLNQHRIVFGREAHMTDDSHRFSPIATGNALPLHEGKTFHQYTDRWKAAPRYALRLDAIADKPAWFRASGHFRLVFREIARSTDERTMIAAIMPPGHLFGHKATCEKTPWARLDSAALTLCAVFNSFVFDWCVRQKTAASMSLFMLNSCPAPDLSETAARFLALGALRLSCNHSGYEPLWRGQFGDGHRFPSQPETPETRSLLRAALDATVAHAYGLTRDRYRRILSSFTHKSNASAPDRCLTAFDALARDGEKMFQAGFLKS